MQAVDDSDDNELFRRYHLTYEAIQLDIVNVGYVMLAAFARKFLWGF